MYKAILITLAIILCFTLAVSIFADEGELNEDDSNEDSTDFPEVSTDYTEISDYVDDPNIPYLPDGSELIAVRTVSPVTPSNSTGLKSALLSVLGNYDAIIVEYQYTSYNGTVSYLREVQPDYVWIWSCILLIVVLYSLFRLLGGMFFGSKR